MSFQNRTPYQEKIIKRYYENREVLSMQRLGELATDLYLAEGKKRQTLWKRAATAMKNLGVPQERIDHILASDDPTLLATLNQELK
ncbi:MAG TPA: hypothetical protein DEB39_02755 [Planctomycetaceae bacterium]|nr:hypothetical protein [Planctomycetaceae bacterium]